MPGPTQCWGHARGMKGNKIQALVKDIKPTAILAAIGDAVGIKKVEVIQAATPARKPADPNKPRKPRAVKTAKAS